METNKEEITKSNRPGRPKGKKSITKNTKQIIIAEAANGKPKKQIAKEFGLTEQNVRYIINHNLDLHEKYKTQIDRAIQAGAGIVAVKAIAELDKKDLSKEKSRTLAEIAEKTSRISNNSPQIAVQINNQLPSSREDLINFLNNIEKPVVIDSNAINQEETINAKD